MLFLKNMQMRKLRNGQLGNFPTSHSYWGAGPELKPRQSGSIFYVLNLCTVLPLWLKVLSLFTFITGVFMYRLMMTVIAQVSIGACFPIIENCITVLASSFSFLPLWFLQLFTRVLHYCPPDGFQAPVILFASKSEPSYSFAFSRDVLCPN